MVSRPDGPEGILVAMPRFVVLDLMRFVLALMVAAGHWKGPYTPGRAVMAVDFFFILSGFVLCCAYMRVADRPDFFKKFMIDRIARLYPLHLATLLLLVPINIGFWASTGLPLEQGWSYQDGHLYTFVANLFLMQSVGLTTGSSWNAPSWSISVEFFTNIFLGLAIIRLAAGSRYMWPFVMAIMIFAYIVLFRELGQVEAVMEPVFGMINGGFIRGIGGICAGMLCFFLFRVFAAQIPTKGVTLAVRAASFAAIAASLFLIVDATPVTNIGFSMIPCFMAAVILTSLTEFWSPVKAGMLSRIMIVLGAASYAVYMLHWPILSFVRYQLWYAWKWPIDLESTTAEVVFLGGLVILAIAAYYLFELPMKRLTKKWITKATEVPVATVSAEHVIRSVPTLDPDAKTSKEPATRALESIKQPA